MSHTFGQRSSNPGAFSLSKRRGQAAESSACCPASALLDALDARRRFPGAADRQLRRGADQARALRSVALLPLRRVRRRRGGSECTSCRSRSTARANADCRHRAADIVVVGDTPRDVACALAHGALPSRSPPADSPGSTPSRWSGCRLRGLSATRQLSCGRSTKRKSSGSAGATREVGDGLVRNAGRLSLRRADSRWLARR